MAMIQGIDGSALLNAFRQGRQDRMAFDKAAIASSRQKAEIGLIGQLLGGKSSGGVAGQMGAPTSSGSGIVATPEQEAQTRGLEAQFPNAPKTAFDQAFSPQAMDAISQGQTPPVKAAPATPMQEPPRAAFDPDILRKLTIIDPETGGKIADAFKTMGEMDLKQHQAKNDIMGAAAHYVQQGATPQERLTRFQHAAPQLMAAGWSQAELQRASQDLSDQALGGFQAVAIDYDKMIDNELAQREYETGKSVPVAPGGNVAIIKPDGSAHWAIGGGASSGIPQAAQDYLRQHPELRDQFEQKYGAGSAASVLGGGGGNATGGFPGQ